MRTCFVVLLILVSGVSYSQQSHLGSWNVVNTTVDLSNKWSVFNELQLRSQSFYQHYYYHELKGGVSYALRKNFTFLVGVGNYVTYADGGNFKKPISTNEFRLWQQLTISNYLERLKIEHRYRVEQRWFTNGTYRNRFRYRLNTVVPINHKKIQPKTFYASVYDEIFLTNKPSYFERNRFFAGGGYQFSEWVTVQPGYLYQFDYRNGQKTGKHFIQLSLMLELNPKATTREKIPTNLD